LEAELTDRRFQVFVSSTFLDLQDERSKVIEALLGLQAFPAGMEIFPASDESQWDLIRRVIDDSDYYIVILGGRYGSLAPDGLSYTEKEYRYAVETETPVLGFVRADPENVPVKYSETDPGKVGALDEFRDLVMSRMCKTYSNADQLAGQVITSLTQAITQSPAEGWVRGSEALTPETREEVVRLREALQNAQEEMALLSKGVVDPNLQQGEDSFSVEYRMERYGQSISEPAESEFTWNELFRAVGPLMFDEASEVTLASALERNIEEREGIDLAGKLLNAQVTVLPDCFQQVKVQLLALGYVGRSQRQRSVRDTATYWTLTPLGEDTLMALRALRRGPEAGD